PAQTLPAAEHNPVGSFRKRRVVTGLPRLELHADEEIPLRGAQRERRKIVRLAVPVKLEQEVLVRGLRRPKRKKRGSTPVRHPRRGSLPARVDPLSCDEPVHREVRHVIVERLPAADGGDGSRVPLGIHTISSPPPFWPIM